MPNDVQVELPIWVQSSSDFDGYVTHLRNLWLKRQIDKFHPFSVARELDEYWKEQKENT